jgi:MFS transporter, SHS family, sialic acid transporter
MPTPNDRCQPPRSALLPDVPVQAQQALSRRGRWTVLAACFLALLFDGIELGMMPVAARSVVKDLLGAGFTEELNGQWFAWLVAAMMLGAACGGIWLGALGDKIGRTRALGVCVLLYSVFAWAGAHVTSLPQMMALRFLVGLGIGGVWPCAIALVAECWPAVSRPVVAGIVGAALNAGILLLSQIVAHWKVTPDSWRWVFELGGLSAVLGVLCFIAVPESPGWQAARGAVKKAPAPLRDLLTPALRPALVLGIALGAVPLVGAWAASKWMVPWAENVAGKEYPGYKASAQAYWAVGAVLGSFTGAQIAAALGRRKSYLLISIGAVLSTGGMFLFSAPLRPEFLWIVLAQGFVTTLFFGWLPLYLPQLYPVEVRATGTGIAYNTGRFATAAGLFAAGGIFTALGSDYSMTGAVCSLVYALGIPAALLLKDRKPAAAN